MAGNAKKVMNFVIKQNILRLCNGSAETSGRLIIFLRNEEEEYEK